MQVRQIVVPIAVMDDRHCDQDCAGHSLVGYEHVCVRAFVPTLTDHVRGRQWLTLDGMDPLRRPECLAAEAVAKAAEVKP